MVHQGAEGAQFVDRAEQSPRTAYFGGEYRGSSPTVGAPQLPGFSFWPKASSLPNSIPCDRSWLVTVVGADRPSKDTAVSAADAGLAHTARAARGSTARPARANARRPDHRRSPHPAIGAERCRGPGRCQSRWTNVRRRRPRPSRRDRRLVRTLQLYTPTVGSHWRMPAAIACVSLPTVTPAFESSVWK